MILNLYKYLTITINDPKCVMNLTAALNLMGEKFNELFKKLKDK